MRWLAILVPTVAFGVFGVVAACGAFDETTPVDAGPSGVGTDAPLAPLDAAPTPRDAGVDGDGDASPFDAAADDCPVGVGPAMVRVRITAQREICIDRTEVTEMHYAAFLGRATTDSFIALRPALPPPCRSISRASASPAVGSPSHLPQRTVSFCSAAAFCAAQGKRLCGSVADGGYVDVPPDATVPDGEWELACTGGNEPTQTTFPWGPTAGDPDATRCWVRTAGTNPTGPRDAGAEPACGPGSGPPYDMIGNVTEWTAVTTHASTSAYYGVRGGPWSGEMVAGCGDRHGIDEGAALAGDSNIGFRCCAEPR